MGATTASFGRRRTVRVIRRCWPADSIVPLLTAGSARRSTYLPISRRLSTASAVRAERWAKTEAKVLRRLDLPLVQIVAGPLPVYAYRTQRIVGLLIPRGLESAADAFVHQHGLGTFLREHCGFLHLRLPIAGGVSSTRVLAARAMLEAERWATDVDTAKVAERKPLPNGRPASAQTWAINASLSKVSRDPEPILSVLVTETAQSTRKEFGPK